jgi:hypothetical protein
VQGFLFLEEKMDFAPGDRVKVKHTGSGFYGRKGTVIKVFMMEHRPDLAPSIHVEFDTVPQVLKERGEIGSTTKTFVFPPQALEKVTRLLQTPSVD